MGTNFLPQKRILVTGANGIIGSYLCQYLQGCAEILPTDIAAVPSATPLDITQQDEVKKIFNSFRPDVIIHLAGKNLKYCESNQEIASQVNVDATKLLVDAATAHGSKFIFISSDYVFDGQRGNYKETDEPNPQTVYGKTKLLAEQYIVNNSPRHAIVRTSGIYGPGASFYEMVLKALSRQERLEPFMDTYFSPTYIEDLAWAIACLLNEHFETSGIFHVCGATVTTRYEMAFKMALFLKANLCLLKPMVSSDNNANIAKNTSLNSESTEKRLNRQFSSLTTGLSRLLGEQG